MIGLIEILISVIKALIFFEKLGIPVEDLISYLEGLLGVAEEETTAEAPVVE